jgi:hypothetical protein
MQRRKAWADGAGQARTAFQRVNYLGTDARGAMNYSIEALTEAVQRAHRGGWREFQSLASFQTRQPPCHSATRGPKIAISRAISRSGSR